MENFNIKERLDTIISGEHLNHYEKSRARGENMRILITGANGFLGRGIVKQLLDNGDEVIAVDFSTGSVDNRAQKIGCNLFEVSEPYEFFGRPDCLLHLAWRNGFVHNAKSHIEELPQHVDFLTKMSENGINRISVLGTMHEVGFYEGSIKEDTPCFPQNNYGIAKNALRQLVEIDAEKNEVIFQWLRGFYIVSSDRGGASIFSKIASADERGEKTFPFTSGLNQYDFLDYDEFCRRIAKTIEQDKINGIINICSGRPEKLADRVERFIKENGYMIKLDYGKYPDRPYDSKAVWGDSRKIEQILKSVRKSDE